MSEIVLDRKPKAKRKPARPEHWHLILTRTAKDAPICCEMVAVADVLGVEFMVAARHLQEAGQKGEKSVLQAPEDVIKTKWEIAEDVLDNVGARCGIAIRQRIGFEARRGGPGGA